MTVKFDVDIENVHQALNNLRQLDFAARRRAASRAVNKATKPMVQLARRKSLPRRTGALWKSIRRTSTRVDWMRGTVTAKVASKTTKGAKKRGLDAFYVHMIVGGVSPHQIVPREKRALSDGQELYGRSVSHPGFRGRDIFEQAMRSGARQSTQEFGQIFAREVESEVSKMKTQ